MELTLEAAYRFSNLNTLTPMRWLKNLSLATLIVLMAGCAGSNLEKMIPADAIGVVSIDVPGLLKKAGMLDDGKIVLPQALKQVTDENETSPLCILFNDLPQLGLDHDSKAYVFFTNKTFGRVVLAALSDPEKTRKTLELRVGGEFAKTEGLNCMYVKDNLYVIDGEVLLVGTVNKPMEVARAATGAKAILAKVAANINDNKDVKSVLHKDSEINVWIKGDGLKTILGKSEVYRELSQKMPLIGIFTESDIDAVTSNIDFDSEGVEMNTHILAAEGSEYARLLNTTLGQPGEDVLKAIPNSMDYIFTICVKGDSFVRLEQVQQLLKVFGRLPYIGSIDLAAILATVDGPFTVGLARDPHLEGEWNMVLATRSSNPEGVLSQISDFANSMGQAPELYEGEYIYQYDNKMIRIGIIDGVLYLKMLDYEQTEGYAFDMKPVRDAFGESVFGFFAQTRNDSINGYFDFGLKDPFEGKGHFSTNQKKANATLEFLRSLCSIRVSDGFGNEEDNDDAFSAFISSTFGKQSSDQ